MRNPFKFSIKINQLYLKWISVHGWISLSWFDQPSGPALNIILYIFAKISNINTKVVFQVPIFFFFFWESQRNTGVFIKHKLSPSEEQHVSWVWQEQNEGYRQ